MKNIWNTHRQELNQNRTIPRFFYQRDWLILLLLSLLIGSGWSNRLAAQQPSISITFVITPPYPVFLSSYEEKLNEVIFTITNNSANPKEMFFHGDILKSSGERVSTRQDYKPAAPFVLEGFETVALTLSELSALNQAFSQQNLEIVGFDPEQIQRTGVIPEGTYRVCLRALDFNTNQVISLPGTGCSNPFVVLHAMPPRLNSPANNYTFCQEYGLLQFNWTPVQQAPGSVIVYDMEIIDLSILGLEDEDPYLPFVDGAARFYVIEDIPTPQYNYFMGGGDLPFEANHNYAWRVRARDLMETTFISDEGLSEVFVFRFCPTPEGGAYSLTSVYPRDNDTIPFSFPYLATRFAPLINSYDRVSYNLVITGEGININRDVHIQWGPQGPTRRMRAFWPEATENQASTIPLLRTQDIPEFRRGRTYTWRGEVTVYQGSQPYTQNILPQRFTFGMPQPKSINPRPEQAINPTDITNIDFEFSPGKLSSNYLPPYTMLQMNSWGIDPPANEIISQMDERWILQISFNDSTFTNPEQVIIRKSGCKTVQLPQRGNIDKDIFKESIEKNIKTKIQDVAGDRTFEDGRYFWRVGWSLKPNDLDNNEAGYHWSKPSVFVLDSEIPSGGGGGGSSSDCMADCEVSAPTDQSTRTNLSIGSEVKVGHFTMIVRALDNPGASNQVFHGRGSIEIPFMNLDIKVNFQNLQVNNENEMYAGTVVGAKDEAVFDIAEEEINGIGIPAIDSSQLSTLESFLITSGRIVNSITPGAQIGLPLGFDQIIDDVRIIIGIVDIKFTPTKATINAVANFNITEIRDDFNLGFGAANICLQPDGFNANNAALYLARDIIIPIETDEEDDPILIKFKGLSNPEFNFSSRNVTHIQLDCNGFKEGQIHIETTFPKSLFTALNANGTDKTEPLKATASGRFDAAGGILLGLTFSDRFYYTEWDDMSFVVQNAWLDLSGRANPPGFAFPEGYSDRALAEASSGSVRNSWTGFYLERATAYFKYVHTSEEDGDYTRQFSVGVEKMLLDHTGWSAKIYMANLINWNENETSLDGWAFALDTIDITFVSNNLVSGSVSARLGFPMEKTQFLRTKFSLAYDRSKSKFKFTITIRPDGNFKVDAWAARLELHSSSKIEIILSDESEIKVDLSGKISIQSDFKEDFDALPGSFNFPELSFERILISSKRGFQGGTINNQSLSSIPGTASGSGSGSSASTTSGENNRGQRMAQFPISINSVDLNVRGVNQVVLGIDMMISITDSGEGIAGGTKLNFVATYDLSNQEFTDVDIELERVYLEANFTPIIIRGEVTVQKRTLAGGGYEERFVGSLDIEMPAELRGRLEGEFGVYAEDPSAPLGSPLHYQFFRIDGRVSGFSANITPWMVITGFGGGVYHRMKIKSPCAMPKVNPDDTRAGEYGSNAPAVLSGTVYERDYNTILGFRVMLQAGFPNNDEVYNLDVAVGAEIAENESGSIILQRLDFQGDVYVLTKIRERHQPKIYAAVSLLYENPGNAPLISGNFDLYVDIKFRGLEILKGNMRPGAGVFTECGSASNVNCGCRAAAARLRIPLDDTAGEEWFFYMGHWSPDNPFGNRGSIMLNVLDLARVEISHYLMAGNGLPQNLPPLPNAVNDIINGPGSTSGDPAARAALAAASNKVLARTMELRDPMSAQGFAMGAYFHSEIDLRFVIFYASFSFTLGFDVNITTSELECHNPQGEGTYLRGLDGWYGQGQAYMGMTGDLGVYVDLGFIQGRFSIINLAAAVMIQAGLPNPEYFRGRVGLRYSILNGMVEGHCNFMIDIGQKCEPVNPNPFGIDFIADLGPNGGNNLSVFTVPVAAYNFPINQILTFEEEVDYDEIRLRHLQAYVDKFEIRENNNRGPIVNSRTAHSNDNLQSRAVIRSWLKPHTWHDVTLTIKAREFTSRTGGTSRQVIVNGVHWEEERSVRFRSGPRPDHLPDENVSYSYPISRQRFYLQDEGIPHIRLDVGMPGLFARTIDGREQVYILRLIGLETRDTIEVPYTHTPGASLTWLFPGTYFPNLHRGTTYCLQIIRRPRLQLAINAPANLNQPNLSGFVMQNALIREQIITQTYGANDSVGGQTTTELTTVSIVGADLAYGEHLIYRYYFRTSQHRTLSQKLQAVNFTPLRPTTMTTPLQGNFSERFDVFDMNGYTNHAGEITIRPMITIEKTASFTGLSARIDNDYGIYRNLENFMNPLSFPGCRRARDILHRNTNRYPFNIGIPPTRIIAVSSNIIQAELSDVDLQNASNTSASSGSSQTGMPFPIIIGGGTQVHLTHEESLWFYVQHHMYMKRNINNLLAERCSGFPYYQSILNGNRALSTQVYQSLARSGSYYHYTPGTYRMLFRYRPPSTNGRSAVNGSSITKSFTR